MAPHQLRVAAEKLDLDEKLDKLFSFVSSEKWSDVPVEEKLRLRIQIGAMVAYSLVLEQRIAAFA